MKKYEIYKSRAARFYTEDGRYVLVNHAYPCYPDYVDRTQEITDRNLSEGWEFLGVASYNEKIHVLAAPNPEVFFKEDTGFDIRSKRPVLDVIENIDGILHCERWSTD
jgi:hypothetical protein